MSTTVIRKNFGEVGFLPVGTSVLWIGCLAVGMVGLFTPYPRPRPVVKDQQPVQAQLMHVELTKVSEPAPPPPSIEPPAPVAEEPPLPQLLPPESVTPPAAPPLVAVAVPSPQIAFSLPTEGPAHVVEAREAVPTGQPQVAATHPSAPAARVASVGPPQPRRLTLGVGEGRQPKPEYPREAALARQQGTVVVRLTVGEDGSVLSATAISPSPFALLNQAAVRVVRESWRFGTGPVRSYEVSIQFDLKKR